MREGVRIQMVIRTLHINLQSSLEEVSANLLV